MLSGEGNAGERNRRTVKNNNKSNLQKSSFARAAHFCFLHFFAVVLHDYNVKLPETTQLHVLLRECRTCSRSLFFHCRSFSPCIGGRQHFSFCHRRYKIVMLFFQQKDVSYVFCLSLQISAALFLVELCWPATYFLCFSVFLLPYIPNLWT